MYNLNGEPMNDNTYSSPSGSDGYTYSAAPNQNNTNYTNTSGTYSNPGAPMNYGTPMGPNGPKKSGILGILGLIFAILAFPIGWFIPIIGIVFAIAAFVLSILGCSKKRALRGTGIAGLIISIIVFIALIILIVVRTVSLLNDASNKGSSITGLMQDLEADLDDSDYDDDYDSDDFDYDYSDDTITDDIDDIVLLDEQGIVVTATSITYETYDDEIFPSINVLVENNSDHSICVGFDYFAVNNVAMDGSLLSDVSAGKKKEDYISIDSEIFTLAGLTKIDQIQVRFDVYDPDTYDTYFEDSESREIVFNNSYAPFDISSIDSASLIGSGDGYDIYYVGSYDRWEDGTPDFVFYVENKTSQIIWAETDEFSVNDFMQYDYDLNYVGPGNGTFLMVGTDDAMDISEITSAEIYFELEDEDYNDICGETYTFIQR